MQTTADILSDLDLAAVFRRAKTPSSKDIKYLEGYYDGAFDVYNAIKTYLREREKLE